MAVSEALGREAVGAGEQPLHLGALPVAPWAEPGRQGELGGLCVYCTANVWGWMHLSNLLALAVLFVPYLC